MQELVLLLSFSTSVCLKSVNYKKDDYNNQTHQPKFDSSVKFFQLSLRLRGDPCLAKPGVSIF